MLQGEREDVTNDAQPVAAVQMNLALLDTLIAEAPIGVALVDCDFRFVRINEHLAAMNGLPVEAHLGRFAHDLFPQLADKWAEHWREVLETGEPLVDIEFGELVRGEYRYALASYYPVRLNNKRIVGIGILVREITSRKRAELAQKLLIELGGPLIGLHDPDEIIDLSMRRLGEHLELNCCALVEIDMHQQTFQIRRPFLRDMPSVEGVYPLSGLAKLLMEHYVGDTIVIEDTTVRPHTTGQFDHVPGFQSIASLVSVPRMRDHRLVASLLATTNKPRRWNSEDVSLLRAAADLVWLAVERARLYQDAQDAIQSRDAFLSVAAHELRTPLTIVLGQAQLLQRRTSQRQPWEPRDERSLEIIAEQARRLSEMVGDLLDISRLESGQLGIERAPLDISALAKRVVDEARLNAPKHTLRLEMPEAPVTLVGDAVRLEQVLQNLISNAIKYSTAGGLVQVHVSQGGDWVEVRVSDEGIGIPQAAVPNLFRRFYRAPNATRERIGGVGVGLYVVKEIVSRHGGTIRVSSVEGQGSTFVVELPAAHEPRS